MLAVFAAPALAQSKECNDENKAAWYDTFLKNFRDADKQKVAYEAATRYRDSCPGDPSDAQRAYMEKFIAAYDKVHKDADTGKQFDDAVKNAKYAEQMRLGKLVLANEPDNVKVYIILGAAGLNDPSLLADSAQYAKRAIEMIEAGKPFAPLFDGSRDKALATLNYTIASATVKNDPTAAIPFFVKALKPESDLKKNPQVYAQLAGAYGAGPVTKLAGDYKVFVGKDETPESKLAIANLNQVIDGQIDALARAAAVATNPADKKSVMDVLTGIYKDRNKSEAGLNELIAGILSKPLPDVPTPITSLPTQTPVSTPTTTAGANGATSSTTGNGTKPSPSPVPATKKPRRLNHSRA